MALVRARKAQMQTEQSGVHTSIREAAEREVRDWYSVFFRWSRGLCPKEESVARRIHDSLASDFRVLLTSGDMMNKSEYWGRLLSLYAAREGHPASHITNLDIRKIGGDHVLATFDLFKDGVTKKKFDSAVLRRSTTQPGRVEWVYVHESAHELEVPPQLS